TRRPDRLAEGPGFEPRLTESESAILALNYPPPERTVGEARERHPTARFELLRQSRPDRRGGSCGGPNGHFRPVWRNSQCWRPLRYIKISLCKSILKKIRFGSLQTSIRRHP